MPDGSEAQVRFVDAERPFGFGQLHVGPPEFVGGPVADVAAQQITTFAQSCPITPLFDLFPLQIGPAGLLVCFDICLERAGGAGVLSQQFADAMRYFHRVELLPFAGALNAGEPSSAMTKGDAP